eukprot:GHRQ01001635.1.p1 GENE.GHRQ01001635.1~~GHRQ01001635.1.p1  ORF type:complete len:344 (+),score=122.34 GHRQ01001635.1:665-1696(+)
MPYVTEGPTAETPRTDMIKHLTGGRGPSGYGSASTAENVAKDWDGTGKVVIITGSNTGLGKEAARALATRGAEVVMAVRDTARGEAAAKDIRMQHSNANIRVMACDLSCLASVRQFAANYKASGKPCHILINNAGVMACPYSLSAEKHEMQFATNHLGHFLLTTELLPVLISTAKQAGSHSRVVVLSSSAHFNTYKKQAGGPIRFDAIDSPEGYDVWGAYGQSKLCNVLFARELHKRLTAEGAPVTSVVCHPGVIMTELGRHIAKSISPVMMKLLLTTFSWVFKSIPQGAATEVYLATSPNIKGGEYYADCNISPSTAASHDAELGRRLWELSEKMVADAGTE